MKSLDCTVGKILQDSLIMKIIFFFVKLQKDQCLKSLDCIVGKILQDSLMIKNVYFICEIAAGLRELA